MDITTDLTDVGVPGGSFLFCCKPGCLVQILVTNFTLKPLQVNKDLTEMFPVELEERRKRRKRFKLLEYMSHLFIVNTLFIIIKSKTNNNSMRLMIDMTTPILKKLGRHVKHK